jgi:hypothetical protein
LVNFVLERSQLLAQVDRLVASHTLHGSESLCRLLRYLAQQAIEHPGQSPKEYQIATEVFGRSADFDPQVDSTVRVQAGRLRSKLSEYYGSEGPDDPVVVELPRGMYALSFHARAAGNGKNGSTTAQATQAPQPATTAKADAATATSAVAARPARISATLVVLVLLLGALATIGVLVANRRSAETANSNNSPPTPAAIQTFWNAFLTGPEEPWVIFSNAEFVGHPDSGMRYFNAKRDSLRPGEVLLDHYTGVGEVLAVHNLDLLFGDLHRSIRVKRGSLFSLDDAKSNDLIFIGSPSENLSLLDLPASKEFVFRIVPDGPRKGNTEIVNVRPQPGEAAEYLATASNQPLTEDYAVITLARGLNPVHSVLILAGTTTLGTQAAVEYATRASSLDELLQRLGARSGADMKPFEALLKVRVAKGVPVGSELVAVRGAQ